MSQKRTFYFAKIDKMGSTLMDDRTHIFERIAPDRFVRIYIQVEDGTWRRIQRAVITWCKQELIMQGRAYRTVEDLMAHHFEVFL